MSARKSRGAQTQALAAEWFRRHGMPDWGDRFLRQITDGDGGCWLWTGRPQGKGYAQIRVGSRRPVAHRLMWEHVNGPVPAGLQLDHLCRVRHCVNPAHLEPVTPRENIMRSPVAVASVYAVRSRCSAGHEFTAENTLMRGRARICRICHRARGRASYARRRAVQ